MPAKQIAVDNTLQWNYSCGSLNSLMSNLCTCKQCNVPYIYPKTMIIHNYLPSPILPNPTQRFYQKHVQDQSNNISPVSSSDSKHSSQQPPMHTDALLKGFIIRSLSTLARGGGGIFFFQQRPQQLTEISGGILYRPHSCMCHEARR